MSAMIGLLVLFIVGALVLVDLLSLFGLAWEVPSVSRAIYHKVLGHIVVRMPEDLGVAVANGLIRKGDELLVAYQHEGNEGQVTRFAVSPRLVGRPVGTVLRIVSTTRKRLVLEEVSSKKDSS